MPDGSSDKNQSLQEQDGHRARYSSIQREGVVEQQTDFEVVFFNLRGGGISREGLI